MSIFDLFRKSPFIALSEMMKEIVECTDRVPALYEAFISGDEKNRDRIAKEISDHEYKTDMIKIQIRQSLPSSIFMPVARGDILQIITSMDAIADTAEDLGILMTFKNIIVPDNMKEELRKFAKIVVDVVNLAKEVIDELGTLKEANFGGPESKIVSDLLDKINETEHETDKFQYNLTKAVLNSPKEIDCASLVLWLKILEVTGGIANSAKKMGNRIRLIISQ